MQSSEQLLLPHNICETHVCYTLSLINTKLKKKNPYLQNIYKKLVTDFNKWFYNSQ